LLLEGIGLLPRALTPMVKLLGRCYRDQPELSSEILPSV